MHRSHRTGIALPLTLSILLAAYAAQASATDFEIAPLDLRIDYLQFGGTYYWSETGRDGVAPYVVGGLGVTRFSPLLVGLAFRL